MALVTRSSKPPKRVGPPATLGLLGLAAALLTLFVGIEARRPLRWRRARVRSRALVGGSRPADARDAGLRMPLRSRSTRRKCCRSAAKFGLASVVMPVGAVLGSVAAGDRHQGWPALGRRRRPRPDRPWLPLRRRFGGWQRYEEDVLGLLAFGPGLGGVSRLDRVLAGVAEADAGRALVDNSSFQIAAPWRSRIVVVVMQFDG